jgi:hypothetical protein
MGGEGGVSIRCPPPPLADGGAKGRSPLSNRQLFFTKTKNNVQYRLSKMIPRLRTTSTVRFVLHDRLCSLLYCTHRGR